MPKLVSPDYKILDGRVVLSKRDDSAHWQIRFKLNNRWIRLTTKKTNFKEAQETAIDIFMDYSFKAKNKLPIVNKTFKSIALIAIDEMKRALDSKIGRKVYKDYIFAMNLYLIPYFGKKHIHTIEYSDLVLFEAWRNEKMKRLPNASSHSGRRTFITNLASKGVGVRVLAALAGHASISTTQRYIDINDHQLRSAVELM